MHITNARSAAGLSFAEIKVRERLHEWFRLPDWIATLSLSNLIFIRCWAELLCPERSLYSLNHAPDTDHYYALMIDVLLLGALLNVVTVFVRRYNRMAGVIMPALGMAAVVSVLNSLRSLIFNLNVEASASTRVPLRFAEHHTTAIGLAILILIGSALVIDQMRVLRLVYALLLITSPVLLVTFGNSIYRMAFFDDESTRDGPFAARLPDKPAGAPRVVWVIFDEWDAELTFPERPARIQLPEIDRLRASGFSATQAAPPNMATDLSMPALTMGMPLVDVRPEGPATLMVRPRSSNRELRWSEQDNVFRQARQMGFNTAVVAWAIPYCRVLKDDLSECWWWSGSNQFNSIGTTLPDMMVNWPRSLFESIYHSPFGSSLSTKRHIWVAENVTAKSLEVAGDRGVGLVLLHMPAPHPPYFYNAATGKNDLGSTPVTGLFRQNQEGYVDALALTDRTIGELRRAMEQAGVWESSTVIFSADHSYRHRTALDGRPVSRRIPFLVKMAGEQRQLSYEKPFNTLVTKELILAILGGGVSRPSELTSWMDEHCLDYDVD